METILNQNLELKLEFNNTYSVRSKLFLNSKFDCQIDSKIENISDHTGAVGGLDVLVVHDCKH